MKTEKNPRSWKPGLVLASLLLMSVCAGIYFTKKGRASALSRQIRDGEIRDLEARFQIEKNNLDAKLGGHTPAASGIKRYLIHEGELFQKIEAKAAGHTGPLRFASKSWEGFPTTMIFERIPGGNAFLVLEKVHSPVKAGLGANPFLAAALFLGALVSALLLLLGLMPGMKKVRTLRPENPGREDFDTRLVASCAKATQSPVLFFRYDTLQGIAALTAEAGFPALKSPTRLGGMSFALPAALIAEIHAEDGKGKRRSLSNHAPLVRLMLSKLAITGFEAWPVIHRVNATRGSSLFLGVLVIEKSGGDPILHREFLGSLLERASRV